MGKQKSISRKIAHFFLEHALKLNQKGNLNAALKNFNWALRIEPTWKEAYFYRGNVFQAQKQYQEAIQDYQKALDLKLDWQDLRLNYGQCLITYGNILEAKNEIQEAIDFYSQAIKLQPDWADIYFSRGMCWQKQEKYSQAIADYQKVIELQQDRAETYLNLGNIFSQQEDWDTSLIYYNKAINLQSDWAEAYFYRGNAFHSQKKYEKGILDYQTACQLGLKWDSLYFNWGSSLMDSAMAFKKFSFLEEAISQFFKAIKINPKNLEAHLKLKEIFLFLDRPYEAIAYLQKASILKPDLYVEHHMELVNIAFDNGNKNSALFVCNLALGIEE